MTPLLDLFVVLALVVLAVGLVRSIERWAPAA